MRRYSGGPPAATVFSKILSSEKMLFYSLVRLSQQPVHGFGVCEKVACGEKLYGRARRRSPRPLKARASSAHDTLQSTMGDGDGDAEDGDADEDEPFRTRALQLQRPARRIAARK